MESSASPEKRFLCCSRCARLRSRSSITRASARSGGRRCGSGRRRHPVAFQRFFHGLRVNQRERGAAVRAGVVFANVHRRTAAGAVDGVHAPGQIIHLRAREVAHKALFDHERRKRAEAPVLLRAAVHHVAAAAHHVERRRQRSHAARAGQLALQGAALVRAVLVQQRKQLHHGLGAELEVFAVVKPDALARKANVQLHHAMAQPMVVAVEPMGLHGQAARGAQGRGLHGGQGGR